MTVMTRISRLFKADMHSILDSLEQPESVLKQAVRDMQVALEQLQQEIDDLHEKQQLLQTHQHMLENNLTQLQQQLHLCFAENDEGLAKSVIRKKMQAQNKLQQINKQGEALEALLQRKMTEIEVRREKLQDITDKLALFESVTRQNGPKQDDLIQPKSCK